MRTWQTKVNEWRYMNQHTKYGRSLYITNQTEFGNLHHDIGTCMHITLINKAPNMAGDILQYK